MKLNNDPIKSAEEYKLYSFKFIGGFNSLQLGNNIFMTQMCTPICCTTTPLQNYDTFSVLFCL